MPKYIELEQAIDLFYPEDPKNDGSDGCTTVLKSDKYTSEEIESMLWKLPAADVDPVIHAKWENCDWVEPDYHGCGTIRIPNAGMKCTNCVHVFKKDSLWKDNYCPDCGAKMDLDKQSRKTRLQDFKEKYPNAMLNDSGFPYVCCMELGYSDHDCIISCEECWNTLLEGD